MKKGVLALRTTGAVHEFGRRREIVIEYDPDLPDLIHVRASGMQTRYTITTGGLYVMLAERQADMDRREKRRRRSR